jgi:hypothetical protein
MPALRWNLTGGSSAIRHPLGLISAQRLLGAADRDVALRTIELGMRLRHIERCVQRGRAQRIPGYNFKLHITAFRLLPVSSAFMKPRHARGLRPLRGAALTMARRELPSKRCAKAFAPEPAVRLDSTEKAI